MLSGRTLAASDESEDGRHAVQVASRLAESGRGALTILTVLTVPPSNDHPAGCLLTSGTEGVTPAPGPELERFERWLGADAIPKAAGGKDAEAAAAFGVPGIEITRLAGLRSAALIVLGRRARRPARPLVLGATADAVVRRSGIPVLFVPVGIRRFDRVLVALDGTERCVAVLEMAHQFAEDVGAVLSAVHVQLSPQDMPSGVPMPQARHVRLDQLVRGVGRVGGAAATLDRRQGDLVEEVLRATSDHRADLLVVGYRRGGPPKVFGPTDVARSLLYAAASAVMTVPL